MRIETWSSLPVTPVYTARVQGRPVSTTRVDGPSWRVSKNAPEFSCRQLGPWTRAVNSGSGNRPLITHETADLCTVISGVSPPQNFFLILKVKMVHFCALLSIDFKVCRLIIETVSDHIRKTVTNRLCFPFPPFFRVSEARNRKYCDNGYKQHFFHTLYYRTDQGIAVNTLKWKDRIRSQWRQEKV